MSQMVSRKQFWYSDKFHGPDGCDEMKTSEDGCEMYGLHSTEKVFGAKFNPSPLVASAAG